ncbi:MAG TPA: translocation/assembly module TamB domain-containing protein, partial [Bdellovibrionota bacterium]|nr:translocation/assembly module TamB domain-containing protein [Bdellovibrionota bacterium]
FRTGVPVVAKSWDLHPTTFSASLADVDFSMEGIYFRAAEIEVQLSPVDLVLGVARFRDVAVRGLTLKGKIPERWLESDPNEPTPQLHEFPNLAAKHLKALNALLAKNRIAFTELALENANLDFSNLKVSNLNFRVINQSRGQARAELSLDSVEVPGKLATTPDVSLSVSLVSEPKNLYAFLVRKMEVGSPGHPDAPPAVALSGKVPGRLASRLNVNLRDVNTLLQSGTWTRGYYQSSLSGTIAGTASLEYQNGKSWQVIVEDLVANRLVYDVYKLERLESAFEYNNKNKLTLRKALLTLPASLSDPSAWGQKLALTEIRFKDGGVIEGSLNTEELSLCSIMIATGVNECFAGFQVNGPATFSGTLSPLKLAAKTDWNISAATVYTEPEIPGHRAQAPLLHTKPAKFVADVMVYDKHLTVTQANMAWATSNVALKGEIKYIPTRVELDLNANGLELSHALSDFMDLPVSGVAALKAKILYDYALPSRPERTKVFGSIEVDKLTYADQPIGQLNAPLLYEKADLNIGPASLASGGGTAILRGVLQNRPGGKSRLEASATLRRYEISILSGSGTNVVRGFYTGVLRLDGFLSENATQTGIRGRINGALDSGEVLGVGLNRIEGTMSLKGTDLILDELTGIKNKRTLRANGVVSPKAGLSYVNFEGADLDVVNLGWDRQIESLFSAGRVSLAGKWSDRDGYKITGTLSGLADPTYQYGNGTFEASGDNESLRYRVSLKDHFAMSASGRYSGDKLNFQDVDVSLKNQGIFLALSYLNEWREKVDLQTMGAVNVKYGTSSGSATIEDLRLRRHNATGRWSDLFTLKGKHNFQWDKSGVRGERFVAETSAGTLNVNPSGTQVSATGKWPAELVDIVIPDFVRLRDGYADGTLALGLPFSIASIRGNLNLNGISVGVKGLGRYGQNTTGLLEFKDSRILFNNFRSSFGGGHVEISGEYKLDWQNPGVYLNANLSNAEFVFIDQVPAVTSGSVVLSGSSYPFDVRGRVTISDGLYASESASSDTAVVTTGDPVLNFDVAIDLGSKFAVRNSLISTNATGAMRLTGTDLNPSFVGIVQLENGRVFARDNEFKIIRGVVDFPASSRNIFINVTANTDIKTSDQTYSVTLNATGTTASPNIEFQSNPPLSLPDIASLLAFGVVRSDDSIEDTSLADTARAEALQTIFGKTIGSTLRNKAGLDVRVSARSDLASQGQTIPKVTVVRKLSKKVTATFGRSLDFSRPENNVQIDYELLRNVNVSGVWENPKPKESSVGFDLRFRWDVK